MQPTSTQVIAQHGLSRGNSSCTQSKQQILLPRGSLVETWTPGKLGAPKSREESLSLQGFLTDAEVEKIMQLDSRRESPLTPHRLCSSLLNTTHEG